MQLQKIGLFLGPILFLLFLIMPVPTGLQPEAWRAIAMGAFMLVWWITEAVPLPVTALLPMVLIPLLGISDMKAATAPYANPIVFLFMGGFMIAIAMERWNLHRRIALNIVKITGTNANRIVLGFLLATGGLSMWISNTATTVMMLPIATSVIDLLTKGDAKNEYSPKQIRNFALTLLLGIAYAANVGGTATIIGTPPTVVFVGFMKDTYGVEVSFAKWMVLGLPFAAVMIAIIYWVLVKLLFPNHMGQFGHAQQLIKDELASLGRLSKGEKRILVIFVSTALAWIIRQPLDNLLPGISLSDTLIAIAATIVLFVVPVNFKAGRYVLDWKDTERLPWGILLLFGGGLSLAGALQRTGLIDLVGQQFEAVSTTAFWILLGLTAVSLFLTEVMSNLALVVVFLPVVGGIAMGLDAPPILYCIPVTLAASCAFMLPMSTPPNAIVFASGHLRIPQMMKAGIVLNTIVILLIALMAKYLIPILFAA